jgi:hypothetical protein
LLSKTVAALLRSLIGPDVIFRHRKPDFTVATMALMIPVTKSARVRINPEKNEKTCQF